MKNIPKIVLTGGPCAGKTTALCYLQQKLAEFGFYVFTVPETATMLMTAGVTAQNEILPLREFQGLVLDTTLFIEDTIVKAAKVSSSSKNVVIYDRGTMDLSAYMPNDMFKKTIKERKLVIPEIRDGRYDAVFHLQTAAIGAEEFYTLSNNKVRLETPEEARIVDEKILQSWIGCPHLRVLDNSTGFDGKLKRLLQETCRVLGIPEPLGVERKFLVNPVDFSKLGHYQIIDIEQVYLTTRSCKKEARVRKRGQNGSFVYYRTTKQTLGYGVRIKTEHHITQDEYVKSLNYQQPGTRAICKKRICFLYNGRYFELDVFGNHPEQKYVLEIELIDINEPIELPPFISIIKEVTGDNSYSNYSMSKIS